MTGSWKGRGNQYIQFARVVYCKLPTNDKQLPSFPLKAITEIEPNLRGGRRECYHSATVAPTKAQEESWAKHIMGFYLAEQFFKVKSIKS